MGSAYFVDQWVEEAFYNATFHAKDVVDLGCGAGWFTRKMRKTFSGRITAIDFSSGMIASSKAN